MKPAFVHVALASLLALSVLPVTAAGPVPSGHVGLPQVASPDGIPPPCLLGIVFCQSTQCNDGIDNDNDGTTDYGGDASCDSSSDNDEYTCVTGYAFADVWSTGSKYGTDVYFGREYHYSCPGGPVFTSATPDYACDEYMNGYQGWWSTTACVQAASSAKTLSYKGTFTCVSSACSGTVSPHTLQATIVLVDNGDGYYDCNWAPAAVTTGNDCPHY